MNRISSLDAIRDRIPIRLRAEGSDSSPGDSAGGIVVISFNVGNGLAPPFRLGRYLRDSGADIIGLQELSVPQAEVIDKMLEPVYPHRLLLPSGFSGKGLLSRLPLLNGATLDFAPGRPDLNAVVDVDGQPLRVFVAHPKPPRVRLSGLLFDPVTDNQIHQVAASAVEASPSVILGDFNLTERQFHHRIVSELGLVDAFQEVGCRSASFPRRLGHTHRVGARVDKVPLLPVIRIDYVWYTRELEASHAWIGPDAGSDHLPVMARLHWKHRPTNHRSEDARVSVSPDCSVLSKHRLQVPNTAR